MSFEDDCNNRVLRIKVVSVMGMDKGDDLERQGEKGIFEDGRG